MARLAAESGHQVTAIALTNLMPPSNLKTRSLRIARNLTTMYSAFCSPTVLREVLAADLVQFEYPFLLPLMIVLRLLGRSFVLDEHGVEGLFIRELKNIPLGRGSQVSARNNAIGFMLKRTPGLTPVIVAIEKLAVGISSVVFTCSQVDALEIRRMYKAPEDKLVVIPNCATGSYFENVIPRKFDRPAVLFLGSFNHPPNVHAASLLVEQIMPRVRQHVADALLVVVGRNPPAWLLSQESVGTVFTGEVEDPRPLVAGADVLVAPIFFGSGTRQKLVDYMAVGKPIVSTTKGAEGLEMLDGIHYLKGDTLEAFSKAIVQLLLDTQLASALGRQAREVARKSYSWDTQAAKLLAAYSRVGGRKAKSKPGIEADVLENKNL